MKTSLLRPSLYSLPSEELLVLVPSTMFSCQLHQGDPRFYHIALRTGTLFFSLCPKARLNIGSMVIFRGHRVDSIFPPALDHLTEFFF